MRESRADLDGWLLLHLVASLQAAWLNDVRARCWLLAAVGFDEIPPRLGGWMEKLVAVIVATQAGLPHGMSQRSGLAISDRILKICDR